MKIPGDLSAMSFGLAVQAVLPPVQERNADFLSKKIEKNTIVPDGFQMLLQTRSIMERQLIRESSRKFAVSDLFYDAIDSRNSTKRPMFFMCISNNLVLTARYFQGRYGRECEVTMIQYEFSAGYEVTCTSKQTVQIGWRDGQGIIACQRAEHKICSIIEAETDEPGVSHIVGMKVELSGIPGNPIFFFKAFRVPDQVLELSSKVGDHEWDRRLMMWECTDMTRVLRKWG